MNTFRWREHSYNVDVTPVMLIENVIDKDKCKEISDQIITFMEYDLQNSPSDFLKNTNPGCWRGYPHIAEEGIPGLSEENKQLLFDIIDTAGKKYLSSIPVPEHMRGLKTNFDQSSFELLAWANVNEPGSTNVVHTHTGSLLSGVMYFNAEDTGLIEFMPQNYLQGINHPAWPYHGTFKHEPNDGDILLFPGYLAHHVEVNTSDHQRINMAFNATWRPAGMPIP